MKKLLLIGRAIAVASLLFIAMEKVSAQPYPIVFHEDFDAAWNAGIMPAGWIDSNLSHSHYPLLNIDNYRTPGHQVGGWALGPDSPATGSLHGYGNIVPFDATDGFIYSRADSAMGLGPNGLWQYDSFAVIDNWIFLPVDSISSTSFLQFWVSTDPGLINNNFLDSLQVYYSYGDTTTDTAVYKPWVGLYHAPDSFTIGWKYKSGILGATAAPTPKIGRIAFRHHVVGNLIGANSWNINVDNIDYNAWPQPISLSSINAKADKNNNVNVYWQTESENNNAYFLVERSIDGKTFKQVGKVKAVGNSTTKQNYSFQDVTAASAGYNKVMYRLRQVDANGKYGFSPVVDAMLTSTGVSNDVKPYLSGNTLRIQFTTSETGIADIVVLNANGQKVSEMKQQASEGTNLADQDFSSMPSGIYIVRISNNKETLINRFVKP